MKGSAASVRVGSDAKSETEDILQKPGIPASAAINALYRCGVPFPMAMPQGPKTMDVLPDVELDAMLQRSYAQAAVGAGRPMADVFEDLERDLR